MSVLVGQLEGQLEGSVSQRNISRVFKKLHLVDFWSCLNYVYYT